MGIISLILGVVSVGWGFHTHSLSTALAEARDQQLAATQLRLGERDSELGENALRNDRNTQAYLQALSRGQQSLVANLPIGPEHDELWESVDECLPEHSVAYCHCFVGSVVTASETEGDAANRCAPLEPRSASQAIEPSPE